jgi:hypothetical protein
MLVQYGALGGMCGWFMLRLEKLLKENTAASTAHTVAIAKLTTVIEERLGK